MFELSIGDLVAFNEEAERTIAKDLREMHRIVESKARMERADHAYRNRTYRLERSTFATVPTFSGDVEVELGARMYYASYVNNRGLMRIDERARRAETEIEYLFDGTAEAIANKSNA